MPAQIARVLDGALRQADGTDQQAIGVGTPAWWRWLEADTTRSFAFRGPSGHFTARKTRRRHSTYWTAYRKVGGQLFSLYLGKSRALSGERLDTVAAQLSERAARNERGRLNPALLTSVPLIGASPAVLATKLYQPPPRPGLVPRTHLLQRLVDALAQAQMNANLISIVYATSGLARGRVLQGRLHAAVDTYRQVLQLVPEAVVEHLFGGISYFVGLGDVLCEQNELEAAEPLLVRAVELSQGELLVYPTVLLQSYLALARLRQARGDHAGATRLLAELMQRGQQRGLVGAMLARIAAAQAQLALAQGDRRAAVRWASQPTLRLAEVAHYPREAEQLTLARLLIAQGRDQRAGPELRDALALLTQLRASAEQAGRVDSQISIDILRALALAAQGDKPAAFEALECALRAGAPEGYVRRFLDQGAALAAVVAQSLERRAHDDPSRAYAEHLLSAFAERREARDLRLGDAAQASSLKPQASELVEALSGRELEVLGLLSAGRGTPAIAQELIVSEGTVKRHVSNIMGKLGVHSRIEAVARARSLGLVA